MHEIDVVLDCDLLCSVQYSWAVADNDIRSAIWFMVAHCMINDCGVGGQFAA